MRKTQKYPILRSMPSQPSGNTWHIIYPDGHILDTRYASSVKDSCLRKNTLKAFSEYLKKSYKRGITI